MGVIVVRLVLRSENLQGMTTKKKSMVNTVIM